jgi:hypothetical protein
MTLAALQRDFRDWLIGAPNGMAQHADRIAGLNVYHNGYRVRLCDSLEETFGRVLLWVGEEKFLAAAKAHIESHPPQGWTLAVYGEDFPDTLAALYPDDPAVAELARLDWALCRAFDGADAVAQPMPADADWDRATLRFVPTLRLGPVSTNAGAIWSALSAGKTPPAAVLLPAPGALLVWRQELVPCFRTIEAQEQAALEMMLAGLSFGDLCTALVEKHGPQIGVDRAGSYLGQWLTDGLVTAIR